ncbi:MAG: LPXTG cell wall anchor domain-containing protein [Pararhodobacter sp.]|nr:LPXTG cell wall anchor domain-containing protein [Pararhodobacter sp.]
MPLLLVVAALALHVAAPPAQAEMSFEDYETPPSDLSPQEADALRARIADEIAAERARAEAERIEAERLAARPLGERLVEARCAACHGPESYREADLGWLGWQATVWRMDMFSGAGLQRGQHAVIVDWLHAQYPPSGARRAMEWLALLAGLVALALALLWLRRRRKRAK